MTTEKEPLGTHTCDRCGEEHFDRTERDEPASCFECDGRNFTFKKQAETQNAVAKVIPTVIKPREFQQNPSKNPKKIEAKPQRQMPLFKN